MTRDDQHRRDQDRNTVRPGEDRNEVHPGEERSGERSRGTRSRLAIAFGLAAASAGAAVLGAFARPRPTKAPETDRATPPEPASGVDPSTSRASWDLPTVKNDRVDFFIEFLMGKNHDKTQKWLERVGRYAPMIRQKLAERGMPQDLLYLAIIESGLDPNAYSSAECGGDVAVHRADG